MKPPPKSRLPEPFCPFIASRSEREGMFPLSVAKLALGGKECGGVENLRFHADAAQCHGGRQGTQLCTREQHHNVE